MKQNLISVIIFAIIAFPQSAFADGMTVHVTNVSPKNALNGDFAGTYKTSAENLMYLLLSAINDLNYSIEEIQFKSGCVLFKAYSKEFIASVATSDGYKSFIKIMPADNNYNFQPTLLEKVQQYIDANYNIAYKKIL